ncbi:MAG: Trk system potassium transporter TrkA [Pseudomonadota bacterium]
MSRVIIAGAGAVGVTIAKYLTQAGSEVTLIDRSEALVNQLAESIDVRSVIGHCALPETLDKAGASDADMVIAVTRSDEVNMIICQVAKSLFDVPVKIARIRNQHFLHQRYIRLFNDDNIPIDYIISPEQEIAASITERLRVPGAQETLILADGRVHVQGVRCRQDCPIINTPLRHLTGVFPNLAIEILSITRDGILSVPSGDDEMIAGDHVYFTVPASHIGRAMAVFGYEEETPSRITVVGGGTIGSGLARRLNKSFEDLTVTLIEHNAARAKEIAVANPSLVVIHGNALDHETLQESEPKTCNALIAVTENDETNVLACLLARRAGVHHTMALSNKDTYSMLLPDLAVDSLISPMEITVSSILRLVRRGHIRQALAVLDGRAEILDANLPEGSGWIDVRLGDADMPDNVRIGAIIRENDIIIGRPDVVMRANDRVILFASRASLPEVEAALAGQS